MIELDPTVLIIMGEVIVALVVVIIGIVIFLFKSKKRDQTAVQTLQGKISSNTPQRQDLFESMLEDSLGEEDSALRKEMASSWVDKENAFYGRLVDMYLKRNSKALMGLDKLLHEYTASYLDLVTLMRERVESGGVELSEEAREQLERLADEGTRLNGRVTSLEGENRRLNKELQDAYVEIEEAMREYSKAFRPAGTVSKTNTSTKVAAAASGVAVTAGAVADETPSEVLPEPESQDVNNDIAGLAEALGDLSSQSELDEPVPEDEVVEPPLPQQEDQSPSSVEDLGADIVALAELLGDEVSDLESPHETDIPEIDASELDIAEADAAEAPIIDDIDETAATVQLASLPEDAEELVVDESEVSSGPSEESAAEDSTPTIVDDSITEDETDLSASEPENPEEPEDEDLSEILDEESFFAPKDEDESSSYAEDANSDLEVEPEAEDARRPVIDLAEDDDVVLSSLGDLLNEGKPEREIPPDDEPAASSLDDSADSVDDIFNQAQSESADLDSMLIDEDDLLAQLDSIEDDMSLTGLGDTPVIKDDEHEKDGEKPVD
ncbi:hypothetical protein ACFL2V_06695 [Pseudomonadota bacterium]